ncbi:MAG: hypothetical protein KAT74_05310 [Candidatus Cloacimonetes bacterium]|nr:hypothetical protein [Candidatus Cloacimonadota bacterium]
MNVAGLGAVIGPGLRHAYAKNWKHFALGSLVRTAGIIFIGSGIISSDPSGMSGWGESNGDEGKGDGVAEVFIGGIIYLWSAIHDFGTLNRSVERYNQKHTGTTISVNPIYYASENAPGIFVSISF